jgi:hypothetical protein
VLIEYYVAEQKICEKVIQTALPPYLLHTIASKRQRWRFFYPPALFSTNQMREQQWNNLCGGKITLN